MKNCTILCFYLLFANFSALSATYLSISGATDPNDRNSWSNTGLMTGLKPSNFTSGDDFVIQSGHSMSTTGAFAISGTGASLTINGSLTANHSVTVPSLTVSTTGTYTHAIDGGTIPLGTWSTSIVTSATLNITGTASSAPSGLSQSFANVIWNCTGQTTDINLQGNLTTIAKDFTITSTNSKELFIASNQSVTVTVGGNLSIASAAKLSLSTTGNTSLAVSGSLSSISGTYTHSINSGTIPTATWDAASTLNITGVTSLVPSGLKQSFGNVIWNCASQSADLNLNGELDDVAGNFTVTSTNNYELRLTNAHTSTLEIDGNVSVASGAKLVLTVNGNPSLSVGGSFTVDGSFAASTAGSLVFRGLTSNTTLTGKVTLNKLVVNLALNTLTLNDSVFIRDELSVLAGTLNTGNKLVLRSDATKTARVSDVVGLINGSVTVERYFSAKRGWRLITSPVISNQTINAAWQEGAINTTTTYAQNQNPKPGYGTHITGTTGAANGFDQAPINYATLKIYNNYTGTLSAAPNTNVLKVSDSSGYFLLVRGDRSIDLNEQVWSTPTSTVLRTTGTLRTGPVNINIPYLSLFGDHNYTLIGNPYASPVDFKLLGLTDVKRRFWAWNPNLYGQYGLGGYVLVDGANLLTPADFDYLPDSTFQTEIIQSGQAVFVSPNALAGVVAFTELSKSSTETAVFRTASGSVKKIRVNLCTVENGTSSVIDGVIARFDAVYSNSINGEDAPKWNNSGENLAIVRNNVALSIEKRGLILITDTIFLKLTNTSIKDYQFKLTPYNFDNALSAYLEDAFLNTVTPISLTGVNTINFSVTNDAASKNPNRFRIIFKTNATLPVNFTAVKAYEQKPGVNVEWSVANETGVKQYEVQHSIDGRNFSNAGTVAAKHNNHSSADYIFQHLTPVTGSNFYRIRSVDIDGKEKYTAVAKVNIGGKGGISLYPNPIKDKVVQVQFNNIPKGDYEMKLYNISGQLLMQRKIVHAGGSLNQQVSLPVMNPGSYQLTIEGANQKFTEQLIVQ